MLESEQLDWFWAVNRPLAELIASCLEWDTLCFLLLHDASALSAAGFWVSEDQQECWPLVFLFLGLSLPTLQLVSRKNMRLLIHAEFGKLQAGDLNPSAFIYCYCSWGSNISQNWKNHQENRYTKIIRSHQIIFFPNSMSVSSFAALEGERSGTLQKAFRRIPADQTLNTGCRLGSNHFTSIRLWSSDNSSAESATHIRSDVSVHEDPCLENRKKVYFSVLTSGLSLPFQISLSLMHRWKKNHSTPKEESLTNEQ